TKAFGNLASQPSAFEVGNGTFFGRMLAQLLLVIQIGLFQRAQDVLVFLLFLFVLLIAAAFFARNGNAEIGCQGFNRFRELLFVEVHDKTQRVAGGSAAKAVIELLFGFYAE